jgi:hypothetical protein
MESLSQSEEALAVAVSLGTQTHDAERFEQLDGALRLRPNCRPARSGGSISERVDEDLGA